MLQTSNPYASNNGLYVIGRSSQSITLTWPSLKKDELVEKVVEASTEEKDHHPVSNITPNFGKGKAMENQSKTDTEKKIEDDDGAGRDTVSKVTWNNDGNWYDIEMKREQQIPSAWSSIYKGYGWQYEIDGLSPDSVFIFRMKRNKETEWGTEVVASTDPSPASTEDLNRAVEMNSEYLITRILDLTRPSHLKKILRARDRNGMTTLMVACHAGNMSIAEKLIHAGSEVNAQSSTIYRTPLIFASIMGRENVAILLDKHNANWSIQDKSKCTALDYAINGGHLSLLKLAYKRQGAEVIHRSDSNGWKPIMRAVIISDNLDILQFLTSKGADVNSVDETNSKSVLMAAILAKKPKFVQYLLGKGANPFYENEKGKSCFKVAKGLEYREITELLTKSCQPKPLLKAQ